MIQYLLPAIQTKNLKGLTLKADIGETHDMEEFMRWVEDGAGWLQIEYTLCSMKIDYDYLIVFKLILSIIDNIDNDNPNIDNDNPRIVLHLVCEECKNRDEPVHSRECGESLLAIRDLRDPKLLDYIELFTSDKFITDISSMISNNRTWPAKFWHLKTFVPIEQYVQNSLEAVQA